MPTSPLSLSESEPILKPQFVYRSHSLAIFSKIDDEGVTTKTPSLKAQYRQLSQLEEHNFVHKLQNHRKHQQNQEAEYFAIIRQAAAAREVYKAGSAGSIWSRAAVRMYAEIYYQQAKAQDVICALPFTLPMQYM